MSTYPAYPGGGVPPAPPDPPRSILTAVNCMYAGAVAAGLDAVANVVSRQSIRDYLVAHSLTGNAATIDRQVSVLVVAAVFGGVVGIALWLWMAYANKKGLSWARVLASVFFGISTLRLVTALTGIGGTPVASRLLAPATFLIGLAAIVLLWRPESTAYYNARSGRGYPPQGGYPAYRPPDYPYPGQGSPPQGGYPAPPGSYPGYPPQGGYPPPPPLGGYPPPPPAQPGGYPPPPPPA